MESLSDKQKRFIEDQLSNCNELMTEEEFIAHFTENGIPSELASKIVNSELEKYRTNPFHNIEWDNY